MPVADRYTHPLTPQTSTRSRKLFAKLKAFIEKRSHEYEGSPAHDFRACGLQCVIAVGGNKHSVEANLRYAGVSIEAFHAECKNLSMN